MAPLLMGFQKKYLRGLAHGIKPVVQIGREGLVDGVVRAINEALDRHELVKIKFNDFKQKDEKEELAAEIVTRTASEQVGTIGHTLILFRPQADPEKRKITVPQRD
jgi:RNA-binding protein